MEHWRRLFPRCGGATYWQINDRWAASTWATLDHRGRWKASHHLVRKTFAPLAVIGIENPAEGTVTVAVVNDFAAPVSGVFTLVATNCRGEELVRESRSIRASGNSAATPVDVFSLAGMLGREFRADDMLVWLTFAPSDPSLEPADNLVLFARPRCLRLARPRLAAGRGGGGGGPAGGGGTAGAGQPASSRAAASAHRAAACDMGRILARAECGGQPAPVSGGSSTRVPARSRASGHRRRGRAKTAESRPVPRVVGSMDPPAAREGSASSAGEAGPAGGWNGSRAQKDAASPTAKMSIDSS